MIHEGLYSLGLKLVNWFFNILSVNLNSHKSSLNIELQNLVKSLYLNLDNKLRINSFESVEDENSIDLIFEIIMERKLLEVRNSKPNISSELSSEQKISTKWQNIGNINEILSEDVYSPKKSNK